MFEWIFYWFRTLSLKSYAFLNPIHSKINSNSKNLLNCFKGESWMQSESFDFKSRVDEEQNSILRLIERNKF